jgi:hypothetical protein
MYNEFLLVSTDNPVINFGETELVLTTVFVVELITDIVLSLKFPTYTYVESNVNVYGRSPTDMVEPDDNDIVLYVNTWSLAPLNTYNVLLLLFT